MHIPVLLEEVIKYLDPEPNQNFIDCTIGGAGHAAAVLALNGPQGKLLGIELDPQSLEIARQRLKKFGRRVILVRDNFVNLEKVAGENKFAKIEGILFDLGLSSLELEKSGRGFTFQKVEPLDMRFDPESNLKASDIINSYSEAELEKIFREYGEIFEASRLVKEIIRGRKKREVKTTRDLVEIISRVKVSSSRLKGRKIFALVFQALRIAANKELENLEKTLPQALKILERGGRLVIISFHSLEDRIAKNFFQKEARDCLCPPETPVCLCHHQKQLKILTKKPIKPTAKGIKKNPRAASACLRAAQKI